MYDILREIASAVLLLLLIILGNLIAYAIRQWARRGAPVKQPTCPRWLRPTSGNSTKCGQPLTDHKCPTHGLIREVMS